MTDPKLSDFIAKVIDEICTGIDKAIRENQQLGRKASINPVPEGKVSDWKPYERELEFDIAVTASVKDAVAGGGKLSLGIANVGGDLSSMSENSMANRVRFKIPVVFPGQPIEGRHGRLSGNLMKD